MLCASSHSLMVHARVSEAYIHFVLLYTTYHIFPVLTIKDMINEDGDPTTTFKLATGKKPSLSHLHVLFCPCGVQKATAHVGTTALNMCHQAQKGFCGIFVGIPQYKKCYLVYVPSTRKIISLYGVVFNESFPCTLAYKSRPYSEVMAVRPSVTYTPCYTSSKEQTGNITTFAQFEEGGLLSETRNDAKSCDKYNEDSIMPPLLSEE